MMHGVLSLLKKRLDSFSTKYLLLYGLGIVGIVLLPRGIPRVIGLFLFVIARANFGPGGRARPKWKPDGESANGDE